MPVGDTITASRPSAILLTGEMAHNPGADNHSLPAYVGAVPPEGVEEWDWEKTWKMMAR